MQSLQSFTPNSPKARVPALMLYSQFGIVLVAFMVVIIQEHTDRVLSSGTNLGVIYDYKTASLGAFFPEFRVIGIWILTGLLTLIGLTLTFHTPLRGSWGAAIISSLGALNILASMLLFLGLDIVFLAWGGLISIYATMFAYIRGFSYEHSRMAPRFYRRHKDTLPSMLEDVRALMTWTMTGTGFLAFTSIAAATFLWTLDTFSVLQRNLYSLIIGVVTIWLLLATGIWVVLPVWRLRGKILEALFANEDQV